MQRAPMTGRLPAALALGFAILFAVTACIDGDVATTTTSPVDTSTIAATSTSTTGDTNTLASGSGCTPNADKLPEGQWFGYIGTATATEISFDLACWFTGEAAVLATAEDGEESPPPNDYYVRNDNPQLRTIPVAIDAEVTWLPNAGDPSTEETVTYAEWLSGRTRRGLEIQPGVWIIITGDEAVEVREQYVP